MWELIRASNTNWHINPPRAPHFGGLSEAAVKSARYHLVRVIGEKVLIFVELSTVLCRIEAIGQNWPKYRKKNRKIGKISPFLKNA